MLAQKLFFFVLLAIGSHCLLVSRGDVSTLNHVNGPDDENHCALVNKRGIELSTDVHPVNMVSDSRSLSLSTIKIGWAGSTDDGTESNAISLNQAHYLSGINRAGNQSVVYVCSTALGAFVSDVLPNIDSSFVLVTGDAVASPSEVLGQNGFDKLANDPRIIRWFAQNLVTQHVKVEPLPNGLDYHTLHAKQRWGQGASPKEQEQELLAVRRYAPPFESRDSRVHDGSIRDSFWNKHRARIVHTLKMDEKSVFHSPSYSSRKEFWTAISKFKYVASPRGRGIDCHRTWETLILGSIPLVEAGPHNRLFEENGLPVVQIEPHEWGQLSSRSVQAKMHAAEALLTRELKPALTLQFWLSKIRKARKCQARARVCP